MNEAPANPPALEPANLHPANAGERWTAARWLTVIALVFAAHFALIYLFGKKKETVPRAVMNVPVLTLADNSAGLLALDDPTLFVLPHQRDFASAVWLKIADVKPPPFRYTEPPRPLSFSADRLGLAFGRFMQTNFFASQPPGFKPEPALSMPAPPVEPVPAQNSTMQIEDALAQRQLPSEISLTNWPYADVLAPCVVQVLVDPAGNVVSTVLLTPSGYGAADQRALEIARALRFLPSPQLTLGRIIFNWHTVPLAASP